MACAVPQMAGDAAGAVVTAPFDWLATAMGGAAQWMFESVWTVIDSTTCLDVTSGEYTKVYDIVFGIALFIMLGFFVLQIIGGMIRREPAALSRAAIGLAKSILGSFIALTLLATSLEITDQLCVGIVNAAGTNMDEMGDKVALLATGLSTINLSAPGAGAVLTIFLASLAIIGVVYRQESDQLGPTSTALGLTGTEQSLIPTLGTGQRFDGALRMAAR